MLKRKVIITHHISDHLVKQVEKVLPNSDWEIIVGKDKDIWEKHINDAEIIFGWKKEMEKIFQQKEAKLRWLQSWTAGVNSLPLDELKDHKIIVTGANGVHAYPISETIFAYILAHTRKIHEYVGQQKEKKWHHAHLKDEVHEKTIGIIGVGAIGLETAKIAKAFNMKVLGLRHSGQDAENVDEMYSTTQLNELLPACDFVVNALPLTGETKHIFSKKQFSLMKESAIFINVGRGDTVNENDLIAALQNKDIAGAGLDVFEEEPLRQTSPLWEMENVIITPHTAGSTENYNKRLVENIFIPNLKSYLKGDMPLINPVDFAKGY